MITSLSLLLCILTQEGLAPLHPPAGTTIERQLRSSPDNSALILREIQSTDRIRYLRSQAEWYEVELISPEQFTFRGWVKGSLPDERKPPPPPAEKPPRPVAPNPLESNKYLWFFSDKIADLISLSLGLGLENVEYKLTGTYTTGQKAGTKGGIYSYSAPGFSLNVDLNFPLLEFELAKHKAAVVLDGQYSYGIASVSFNSDFSIPQLQGSSYSVDSHLYDLKALFRYEAFKNVNYKITPSIGLGYLLYEVLPDLNPIEGGTFDGQLVVGDSNFSGLGFPIGLDFTAFSNFSGRLMITPYLLLTDISEDIVNASKYETSGLPPLSAQLLLNYEIARQWNVLFDLHYLKFEGSSSGSGTRLGNQYTDGAMTLQSISVLGGLKYSF